LHFIIHWIMKLLKPFVIAAFVLLTASMFSGCMTMMPTRTAPTGHFENPQWAPPYYSGARYYYLPDLELYYDLASQEYIYLLDGRWHFSPYVPAIYQNYELDNCFCVVLNVEVYKPWLHHQYYISHYPRYYYRDYYDHSNIPYVRAYNENLRSAIYWNEGERNRARPWDDENLRDNRRFKYSREDKKEQKTQTNQGSGTFGGQPRGQQQGYDATRPETQSRSRSTTRPANTNQTRTETNNSTPATTRQTTAPTRQESTPVRQATTKQETDQTRNNRTNYYGKTIGNSVRVTKEMRDNTPAPAPRKSEPAPKKSRQTDPER